MPVIEIISSLSVMNTISKIQNITFLIIEFCLKLKDYIHKLILLMKKKITTYLSSSNSSTTPSYQWFTYQIFFKECAV